MKEINTISVGIMDIALVIKTRKFENKLFLKVFSNQKIQLIF